MGNILIDLCPLYHSFDAVKNIIALPLNTFPSAPSFSQANSESVYDSLFKTCLEGLPLLIGIISNIS
jgi:hypothetical protein